MNRSVLQWFAIILPYWLGMAADALWAIALFVPRVFGTLTGNPDFDPDRDFRLTMAIGGVLMAGWTILLSWAVRDPIERRFVILLTAFPVVFGLFAIALIQVLHGNTFQIWILIKTTVLFLSMIASYFVAGISVQAPRV
jgi:hypothetical protein